MNSVMRGRNLVNILLLSLGFMILFFLFVAIFLIPTGKQYKKDHKVYMKATYERNKAQDLHDETMMNLKDLQEKNRPIIVAYTNMFDPDAFAKQYKRYFKQLKLTSVDAKERDEIFDIYEVKATSHIHSPTDFYDFLEAVNKSENIISIEFPIRFVADKSVIHASFRLKVFNADFDNKMNMGEEAVTVKESKGNS
jgi:hypothetical protein